MLQTSYVDSSFGTFEIKASDTGIRSLKLCAQPRLPSSNPSGHLAACTQQLTAYFEGKRTHFEVTLDWGSASEFYRTVWTEVSKIPYGHTSTYAAIAAAIGNPKSVRAVGRANKYNPIAIIVPCHRVIAKSGHLQGYFYGLDMKRALLGFENPKSFAPQNTLF